MVPVFSNQRDAILLGNIFRERAEPSRAFPEFFKVFPAERLLSMKVTDFSLQRMVIGHRLDLQRGGHLLVNIADSYVRHSGTPYLKALWLSIAVKRTNLKGEKR